MTVRFKSSVDILEAVVSGAEANVDVSLHRPILPRTGSAAEVADDDDLGEDENRTAANFNRSSSGPRRSLSHNEKVRRKDDDDTEVDLSQVVLRTKPQRSKSEPGPRPLTISRRQSVKIVLRKGSTRAARVASMIVVPRARIEATNDTLDDQLKDWIDNYRCWPPPLFMIIVSVAELAVFIAYAVDQSRHGITTTIASGVPGQSPLIYQPSRRYEIWRYLTYMFLHNGYIHIIANLLFQLLIGIPLEMVHKSWRIGPLYIIGVLSGSLATSIVDPAVLLCGASGGCYALLGAQLATITMNWREMKRGWCDGPVQFLLSGPFQLAFWSTLGYLVGLCILKNFEVERWERRLRIAAVVILSVFVVFAICFNAAYEAYYPLTDWRPCCPHPIMSYN